MTGIKLKRIALYDSKDAYICQVGDVFKQPERVGEKRARNLNLAFAELMARRILAKAVIARLEDVED